MSANSIMYSSNQQTTQVCSLCLLHWLLWALCHYSYIITTWGWPNEITSDLVQHGQFTSFICKQVACRKTVYNCSYSWATPARQHSICNVAWVWAARHASWHNMHVGMSVADDAAFNCEGAETLHEVFCVHLPWMQKQVWLVATPLKQQHW